MFGFILVSIDGFVVDNNAFLICLYIFGLEGTSNWQAFDHRGGGFFLGIHML